MQGGRYGSNKAQIIPEENLTKILSFDKASEQLNQFNKYVVQGGMSLDDYFNRFQKGNTVLRTYVTTTDQQSQSVQGLIRTSEEARAAQLAHNEAIQAQTFSAKAGKVALQALAMAGNMIAMWAISKVISIAVEKIDDLAHSAEHCAERVDELMSNYQSALDKANSNAKTVENLASRYEELSKGVNNLGQNVSLTADEYSEYNDIVNQIADMFPTMVQGYTNESNAILSLKGNVELLRDAYKEAQQEAYNMLIVSGEDSDGNDIVENYHNTISNSNPFIKLDSTAQEYIDIINSFHEAMLTSDEAYNQFYEEMIKNKQLINEYNMSVKQFAKIKKILDDIGFKSDLSDEDKRAINNSVKSYTQTYQAEIDNTLQGMRSLANAYLMTNEDYAELDDDAKTAASLIVNGIDTELANGFEKKTDVGDYVANIVSLIKDNPDVQDTLIELFSLDINNMPVNEARELIDIYIKSLAKEIGKDQLELKAMLGFDDTVDTAKRLQNSIRKITDDHGQIDHDEYDYLMNEVDFDSFTQAQAELWLEATNGAKNATQAIEMYRAKLAEVNGVAEETEIPTISSSIQQIATQLEPQFAKLGEAYKAIFTSDGFTLDDVDNSMLENLRQSFAEIGEEVGVAFDASVLEPFFDALTNDYADAEEGAKQVQEAFNNLATAYFYGTDTLDQLTSETADAIEKQLEEMGVQNAAEIVADTLKAKTEELIVAKKYYAQTSKEFASATEAEQTAFILEQIEAGNCGEALALLQLKKVLVNSTQINTAADIQQIMNLASAAGMGEEVLIQLANAKSILGAVEAGQDVSLNSYQKALDDVQAAKQSMLDWKPLDFGDIGGGTSKAGSAGKEAGDAYVDAFEEELEALEQLRENGIITEKEYLDRLRVLYEKYFKDKLGYEKEFAKYQRQYLEGYKSLYESALNSISKLMSKQIDGYSEAKESAVSSLTEEKEARLAVIDAQKEQLEAEKDLIDEQIDAKQKIIDGIQDEIDAMKEAREERQRQLDLQKAQYELERMMHQRTILQYSENKGMHYVNDSSGARDAKEKVDDAKYEIAVAQKEKEIDLIQKQIDLLEEKKDLIQDQIDALDEQADQIESYYSKMITETEKYYDSLINNMEKQKSKWEELAEIEEIAQAYSDLEQVFGDMGYTVQDILNGSEQAFEDFKSKYISILSDMNQNTSFQEGLEYASGVAKENFGSIVSDAQEAAQELSATFSDGSFAQAITKGISDGTVSAKNELDSMNQLGKDAGDGLINGWGEKVNTFIDAVKQAAINAVAAFAEGQDSHSPSEAYKSKASDAIDGLLLGVEENKQAFIDAVRSLAEEGVLAFEEGFNFKNSTLNDSFDSLKLLIESVTEALGIGTDGTVGGLLGALTQISDFSFNDDSIITQFNNLKTAIDEVTSAISGGGESSGGESQSGSGSVKGGKSGGKNTSGESGASSLTGAINEIGSTASKIIGEPEAEGDGTVIGEFGSMKTAVDEVTSAIGSGGSEGSEEKGGEDEGNLIGSITDLGTTAEETLGEPGGDGVIGRFEEFKDVIGEANEHVTGISEGLAAIDGQEVECTIKVNIETSGGLPAFAEGTLGTNMNLESGEYTVQYGKAFAEGTGKYKGLPSREKNALVSEYGQTEMTVLPNGKTILTDEPTMMDLPKDTVIFNEEQTKKIMDSKIDATGNAYVGGTVNNANSTVQSEPLTFLNEWDRLEQLAKALGRNIEDLLNPLNSIALDIKKETGAGRLLESINNVNNVSNNNSKPTITIGNINVTCPGVTEQQVAAQLGNVIGKELDRQFSGFHNYTDQMSRMR